MLEPPYSEGEQRALLDVARGSLEHGLEHGGPLSVEPEDFPPALRESRASFVTLRQRGDLRGCMGRLQAEDLLVRDVSHNAYRSGFHDPRFPPLERWELESLEIHVSVLSLPEPLPRGGEAELLAALRPREDGLIVRQGARVATFLPAVWESLPDPVDFVRELKRKAGIPDDAPCTALDFERYGAVEIRMGGGRG